MSTITLMIPRTLIQRISRLTTWGLRWGNQVEPVERLMTRALAMAQHKSGITRRLNVPMSAGTLTRTGQNYIGGGWAPASSGDTLTRRCPLDDCTLGPYADASSTAVDMAVASANAS